MDYYGRIFFIDKPFSADQDHLFAEWQNNLHAIVVYRLY